jgi:hypothetical protein
MPLKTRYVITVLYLAIKLLLWILTALIQAFYLKHSNMNSEQRLGVFSRTMVLQVSINYMNSCKLEKSS